MISVKFWKCKIVGFRNPKNASKIGNQNEPDGFYLQKFTYDASVPQLRGRLYEKTYKVEMGGNFPTSNTRLISLVIFDLNSFHKSTNGLFISSTVDLKSDHRSLLTNARCIFRG